MTTLLVLTVGQSDVQLVVDDARRELSKRRCADLHDEIQQRVGGWRLVDSPAPKAEAEVDALPSGELPLCTPKLDAVLCYLDAQGVAPTAALVLETRRDAMAAPGDPRFAGAVLETRLREKGVERIFRRAYLEGTERLENRDQPRDAVIRREVVRRLEQAVREVIETVKPSRVVVATTGGFPAVSDLVEEIVRLYASTPVDALEVADGAKADPPTGDRAVARTSIPEPLTSFQARRRALDLIAKGNLLGAWAMAEPLHGDETERAWTQVIEWLACFASSLPMPESCDIPILTHKRMAVRAALRVEFALRAGDIPRAVHGTVAFFEAALRDHLDERFERSSDPNKRRYFRLKSSAEPPTGDKLLRKGDGSEEDRKRPFEVKETLDGIAWYWIDEGDAPAGRLAKYYLKREGLAKLATALSRVRELRNDVAHNEPTPQLMQDARGRMNEACLWSKEDQFLTQDLVRNVLSELGVSEPQNLCEGLISTVRNRLLGGGHE